MKTGIHAERMEETKQKQLMIQVLDFFPQKDDKMFQGCFVEYHPLKNTNLDWNNLPIEDYIKQREEIIKNSEYHEIPLIVITDLKQLN